MDTTGTNSSFTPRSLAINFATSTSYPSCSPEAPTEPKGGNDSGTAILTTPDDKISDKSAALAVLLRPIAISPYFIKLNIFLIVFPFKMIIKTSSSWLDPLLPACGQGPQADNKYKNI